MSPTGTGTETIGDLLAPTGLLDVLDLTPAQLLDPLALLTPLHGLLSAFGTGVLPAGPGDPTAMLTGLAQTLQTGVGAASAAIEALSGLWAGDGAAGAAAKTALAAGNAGALAAQGTAMAADLQGGLAVVGTGLAALQGVIAKTAGLIAATMPAIMTPPGQAAALGFAAEGVTEGLAVIAATRAQLAVPTAKVAVDGAPVPVTPPPITADTVTGLLQAALPLMSSGLQLVGNLAAPPPTAPMPTPTGTPLVPGSPSLTVPGPPTAGTPPAVGAASAGATPSATPTSGAAPTVRPVGVVDVPATPEPALGERPVSGEPAAGAEATPSTPGWDCPVTADDDL
ncbi:hypothetical protein MUG78_02300 [Gordonia alkaliphila]|uniref:hypothetical protein n=1 Tax=Gordonia alkaliphila TaxID=1053547 RepID=UPI001FF2207F|nr:hypothetical protein [Gordonia alkaliphila]MCK0438321.1 hypothetical protein [Gordonia alkaliphila]